MLNIRELIHKFRFRKSVFVKCCWDSDAGVWYVAESNIDGLAADAETIDGLVNKLDPMIRDLEEADDRSHDRGDGPSSAPDFNLWINRATDQHLNHC